MAYAFFGSPPSRNLNSSEDQTINDSVKKQEGEVKNDLTIQKIREKILIGGAILLVGSLIAAAIFIPLGALAHNSTYQAVFLCAGIVPIGVTIPALVILGIYYQDKKMLKYIRDEINGTKETHPVEVPTSHAKPLSVEIREERGNLEMAIKDLAKMSLEEFSKKRDHYLELNVFFTNDERKEVENLLVAKDRDGANSWERSWINVRNGLLVFKQFYHLFLNEDQIKEFEFYSDLEEGNLSRLSSKYMMSDLSRLCDSDQELKELQQKGWLDREEFDQLKACLIEYKALEDALYLYHKVSDPSMRGCTLARRINNPTPSQIEAIARHLPNKKADLEAYLAPHFPTT